MMQMKRVRLHKCSLLDCGGGLEAFDNNSMSTGPQGEDDVQISKDPSFQHPVADRKSSAPNIQINITQAGMPGMLKYFSLVLLTLQNAVLILIMRYVRTREGDMFMATTAVISSEVLKLITSLIMIFFQEGEKSITKWRRYLYDNLVLQPVDNIKVSVPSIVYTLQNNLLYVALSNLEAATFQVTYQLKILTTALFSVVMLSRQLSHMQWISLVLLFAGVSTVQLQPHDAKVSDQVNTEQNPLIGLIAVIVSCLMSGFAGVYFEKILKGTKPSIWLRNVQLAALGIIIGFITMEINDGPAVHEKGFFFGYDWIVWIVICLNSFGGLVVAVVVKYADNILKGFATSAAIVLSCIASVYFFDFQISIQFSIGATLVILSVYMYSKFVPPPREVLPSRTRKI